MTDSQDYANLIERLRGIYRIPIKDGAGPLKGSTEYVRQFDGLPPINAEAASAIATLMAGRDRYRAALVTFRLNQCKCECCDRSVAISDNALFPPEKPT